MTSPSTAARPLQGIALLLTALACFVVLDTSVKHISAVISVLIAVWFRYMFQAVVMSAVLLPLRGKGLLRTREPWLQVARGLLLLIVSVLGYYGLTLMPVAEFTAIVMLTPLMVTLLAALFLKEQVSLLRWLLVGGGFAGALLIVRPWEGDGGGLGWVNLLPLVLVLAYAVFQILTSRLARTEDALTMHLYTGWVGALAMTLVLPLIWQSIPDHETLALLFLLGLMGTVGHYLLILAFARAPAATLTPFLYAQIAFAMLAGWWVFDHVPGHIELGGIALIMVCGALAAWLAARPAQRIGAI
jgi:drug/metabolite transporter (DMT)-like permease